MKKLLIIILPFFLLLTNLWADSKIDVKKVSISENQIVCLVKSDRISVMSINKTFSQINTYMEDNSLTNNGNIVLYKDYPVLDFNVLDLMKKYSVSIGVIGNSDTINNTPYYRYALPAGTYITAESTKSPSKAASEVYNAIKKYIKEKSIDVKDIYIEVLWSQELNKYQAFVPVQ